MTDEQPPDSRSRRARLATRRAAPAHRWASRHRRGRWSSRRRHCDRAHSNDSDAGKAERARPRQPQHPTPADRHRPRRGERSSRRRAARATPIPSKLWIGGDSLAGSFGPALGQTAGRDRRRADATIDYKVSSGLEDQRHPRLVRRARTEQMTSDESRRGRVHHRHERHVDREHLRRATTTASPTGKPDYRAKVDRMMETFVGGAASHRVLARTADARRPERSTRARRRSTR